MINHNNKVDGPMHANGGSTVARVRDSVRMNRHEFFRSQINEDPQNFVDEIKKIIEVMQVTGNDRLSWHYTN